MQYYDISHINKAIIHILGEFSDNKPVDSAKELEGLIGQFFLIAADWRDDKPTRDFPYGYCYPWRTDIHSLTKMCAAIKECIQMSSSHGRHQLLLVRRIIELSEELMAKFRQERDAGTYRRNTGYIVELDDKSDWGRWMLALRATFIKPVKSEVP